MNFSVQWPEIMSPSWMKMVHIWTPTKRTKYRYLCIGQMNTKILLVFQKERLEGRGDGILTGMAKTARTHRAGETLAQPMVWGLVSSAISRVCVEEGDGVRVKQRTNPFMMWLVDVFVDTGMMFEAMDPVNGKIVESHIQSG
jgi:hypothetical protein